MHTLSVTAALVLSTIAGTLATSAVLNQEPAAQSRMGSLPQTAPCENVDAQIYVDVLGEPVVIGCLPPLLDTPDMRVLTEP